MITETQREQIITRLDNWGRAVAGGIGGYARITCLLGVQTGSAELSSYIPINPEVELTERAVCLLPESLRNVVIEHYTVLDATAEQHWWALRMSRQRYYRALNASYQALADNLAYLNRAKSEQNKQKKTGINTR